MTGLQYFLITIVSLCLIFGTIGSAEQIQVTTPALNSAHGIVTPHISPISGDTSVGPEPLVKSPVLVQTGIVKSPVVSSSDIGTITPHQVSLVPIPNLGSNSSDFAPDRLIVKYKTASFTSASEMKSTQDTLNQQIGVEVLDDVSTLGVDGMQVVNVPDNKDVLSIARLFKMHPNVEYAEPDYILSIDNGFKPGQVVKPPSVSNTKNSGPTLQSVQQSKMGTGSVTTAGNGVPEETMVTAASAQYGFMKVTPTERQQICAQADKMDTLQDAQTIIAHGSRNLLPYLSYNPTQRNQGSCGNCWVWASTGLVEIAKTVQTGIKDRLSIQYFNSNYNEGAASNWACMGGWSTSFATFHNTTPNKRFIPWSNPNASYLDGTACSSGSCSTGTKMPASSITTSPNYPINSISTADVNTYGITQSQAINNIKTQIDQNKAVWWAFFLPNSNAWNSFFNFWGNQPETAIWNPDPYNGIAYTSTGGGHAVIIVGYDDTSSNPDEWYWVVLNSWGTTDSRPNGLFRLKMMMDYSGNDGSCANHYFNIFNVDFADQPDNGSISATSSPLGAAIWIDEVNSGRITPDTLSGVTAGSHTITLKKSGYSNYQTTITVSPGETTTINGVFSQTTTTGSISVSSSPKGASVYLDSGSKAIGVTPLKKGGISQGVHTIKVTKSGYVDYVKSITINSKKITSISASLKKVGTSVKPNDPDFSKLYGLDNTRQTGGSSDADIDAPEAWAITRGSPSVIVAVIDTGVDYNHPDLKANCVPGYDYANNDANPMDDNGHGTHVAGTIAAIGNNKLGVSGIAWNTKIMPLKFLTSSGSGYTSNAIKAINYAKKKGAKIVSCSWGRSGTDSALKDAITNAPGILFVCSAGNSAKNIDRARQSPASFPNSNIIAVAASDSSDKLASFSNYGAKTVDVVAPGVSILSTTPGGKYSYMSGTSMATPHVTGIAALIKAKKPSLTSSQIKNKIIKYVDKKSVFSGKMVSGGRVNAYKAVKNT